jgi:hypothetical protein
MMASVNVNGDEVVGTDVKQEAPGGFKFGFRNGTTQEHFASELTLCHPLVLQRIFKDFQLQPTNQMP